MKSSLWADESGLKDLKNLDYRFSLGNIKRGEVTLSTDDPEINAAFRSGIRSGQLVEWGLPHGRRGRILPLLFLRDFSSPIAWIYSDLGYQVYPPAWASFGIDLKKLFFISCDHPVERLKPLFLQDTFKVLVIDSPTKISKGDLSFLVGQARKQNQVIFLIRNYFLSAKNGNPLAQFRVNGSWDLSRGFFIHFVKGSPLKTLTVPHENIPHNRWAYGV